MKNRQIKHTGALGWIWDFGGAVGKIDFYTGFQLPVLPIRNAVGGEREPALLSAEYYIGLV